MLWTRERDARPLETPEQRTDLLDRLAAATEAICDRQLRQAYQSDLRARAFDHFRDLRPLAARRARVRAGPASSGRMRGPRSARASRAPRCFQASDGGVSARIAFILTALIDFPALIAPHVEEIAASRRRRAGRRPAAARPAPSRRTRTSRTPRRRGRDRGGRMPAGGRTHGETAGPARVRAAEQHGQCRLTRRSLCGRHWPCSFAKRRYIPICGRPRSTLPRSQTTKISRGCATFAPNCPISREWTRPSANPRRRIHGGGRPFTQGRQVVLMVNGSSSLSCETDRRRPSGKLVRTGHGSSLGLPHVRCQAPGRRQKLKVGTE